MGETVGFLHYLVVVPVDGGRVVDDAVVECLTIARIGAAA